MAYKEEHKDFEKEFNCYIDKINNGKIHEVYKNFKSLENLISKNEDIEKYFYLSNILNLFLFKENNDLFIKDIINYINRFSFDLGFFIRNLTNISITLSKNYFSKTSFLNDEKNSVILNFVNSNFCKLITSQKKEIVVNRFVNYHFENGFPAFNGNSDFFNRSINVLNNRVMNIQKKEENLTIYNNTGIEDIRLFEDKKENKIRFLATTLMFNNRNLNEIVLGELKEDENILFIEKVFKSPKGRNEKNWLVLDNEKIIYSFYPYRVYDFSLENILIEKTDLPKVFQLFRGSSNPVTINNFKYVLVHSLNTSENYNPGSARSYSHWIVLLDNLNIPIAYSVPFVFEGCNIEYCLSMNYLENGNLEFCYSCWDNSSKYLEIPLSCFSDKFLLI